MSYILKNPTKFPSFDKFMDPIPNHLGDGEVHHIYDAESDVLEHLNIPKHFLNYIYFNAWGKDKVVHNKMRFANLYLKKAGLIRSCGKGHVKITKQGKVVFGIRKKNRLTRKLITDSVPGL